MFYSEVLPKAPGSAAEARRVLDRLAGQIDADRLADARLLVSELIANAVEHVAEDGEIELRIDVDPQRLRVEVLDPGPGFTPVPRRAGDPKDSGWGLHFMAQVADRWAADIEGQARVWFELGARRGGRGA
ncbi:ATP-binding protein [Candidatus Solirubrobacter pratensis]|uniref:ATP-binding protein n=1 Tax=Candidatus Solirubrobacter pratensis TaxID=1298857 RepID=UPI0009DBE3E0|nr:ATP-binding protein [Candidatus Solirubrobacter pratensis]